MHKNIFRTLIILVTSWLVLFQISCKKEDYLLFNAPMRIQWKDTTTVNQTFADKKESIHRDTVWLKASIMGGLSSEIKKVNVKQIQGFSYSYTYDKTGAIIDTIATEVPNQAVPGTHYVPFKSEEMQKMLLLKTKKTAQLSDVEIDIPIIILRDKSLDEKNYSLFIELERSSDFLLGESEKITKVISISNRLIKPTGWGLFQVFYLGRYSYVKHKFMNETLGTVIDNNWLKQPRGIVTYYREKCRRALDAFNTNPDNIANGIAPLREDPDNPQSRLINFPTIL